MLSEPCLRKIIGGDNNGACDKKEHASTPPIQIKEGVYNVERERDNPSPPNPLSHRGARGSTGRTYIPSPRGGRGVAVRPG